jgi:hypothetical protein
MPCPRSLTNAARRNRLATAAFRLLLAVALGAALVGGEAGPARADGDPASDVLVSQPVFLASDSGASIVQEERLQELLSLAARDGHPLRVAVIASQSDLGSVTALWREPESYAAFLGRELSLVYHGELLVVMPNGFGVFRKGTTVSSGLVGLAPRRGQMITATVQAIEKLTGVTPSGATLKAPRGPARSATAGAVSWTVAGAALLLIATAWTMSLRARPASSLGWRGLRRSHP